MRRHIPGRIDHFRNVGETRCRDVIWRIGSRGAFGMEWNRSNVTGDPRLNVNVRIGKHITQDLLFVETEISAYGQRRVYRRHPNRNDLFLAHADGLFPDHHLPFDSAT